MMQGIALLSVLTAAVAAAPDQGHCQKDDEVSMIQVAAAPSPHSHMEWHIGKTWEAFVNNLGGIGPLSGEEELRFHNVSAFYTDQNIDETGIMLDLLVQTVSPYTNNQSPNKNGGHGEFGAIQFDPESGTVFRWSFVKIDTYEKVVIPDFVITFFDLDQQSNRPPCDENITAWDVHSYGIVPDAFTQVTIEGADRLLVCSNTPGSVSNPRTVNGLSADQKKAGVILAYQDTAEFVLSLRNSHTGRRKFQFSGPSASMEESVTWYQAHPTPAPTAAPTGSPTGMPTHSPTSAPTAAPTASPTGMPTHSPTSAPTAAPTASPTGMPTHSPTSAPTAAPTASPTGVPTHSPTSSPTMAPTPPTPKPTASPTGAPTTASPTGMPTHSPTPAPTSSPTGSPTAVPTPAEPTAFGDPHVMNTAGEKFDVLRAGSHVFLSIPRGADDESADLQVRGLVEVRGEACRGQRYITEIGLTGGWLGDLRSLALSTATEEFDTPETLGLRVAESGNLSAADFASRVPEEVLELRRLHPQRPVALNQHVATLVAKLTLGPVRIKVTWQHTKEKTGASNSLSLLASGLGKVGARVGGLLGEDSHTFAASLPSECAQAEGRTQGSLLQQPHLNGVQALALLGEEGDGDDDANEDDD